jgi:hypothetical protein
MNVVVRKPEGKKTLGRRRRRSEGDIEIEFKRRGYQRID